MDDQRERVVRHIDDNLSDQQANDFQLLLVAKCNPELLEIASTARRCGSLEASMARAQSAAISQASTAIRPALDKADRSSFGRIDYAGQMSAPGTFVGDKPKVLVTVGAMLMICVIVVLHLALAGGSGSGIC